MGDRRPRHGGRHPHQGDGGEGGGHSRWRAGFLGEAGAKDEIDAQFLELPPDLLAHRVAVLPGKDVVNRISDVKLLQGDLSEAWSEGQDEYATVAMRYSLNDKIVDRASGRVVEEEPSEATELWTFRRARGGQWMLSAIQQT